ncbi:unnamed protein product [Chrysoparadoxa australica]
MYHDSEAAQWEQFTVRVNTFRRNDLLKKSVDHFTTCLKVREVQVVWSDLDEAPPPKSLFAKHARKKVVVETHMENSLSNRFKVRVPLDTQAVLSIDDDLIISCDVLDTAFTAWRASPNSLVGFVPRLVSFNGEKGEYEYRRWWLTWWNGIYNIILTKACFLNKRLLHQYFELVPEAFLQYIDKHRNCEDIAMSFVAAMDSQAPPVWVKGKVTDAKPSGGISKDSEHDAERSACVNELVAQIGRFPLTLSNLKVTPARDFWLWF